MLISVIVPCLNEEKSLEILYQNLKKTLADCEIVFVNDGSTDSTRKIIDSLAAADKKVKAIHFDNNKGKSAALEAGFEKATGDIIIQVDADLQYLVERDIPRIIQKLNEGYDMVNGYRIQRFGNVSRRLVSKFYNIISRAMLGLSVKDQNCGFKIYKRDVVKCFNLKAGYHRYLPAIAHLSGFKVGELEVVHTERKHGKSRYGFFRIIEGFRSLISVWWRYGFGRRN